MTSRFENEADETRMSNATEDETSIENEDESDQAKASSISLEFLFFLVRFSPSVSHGYDTCYT